jgi:hypothetical protein
MAIYVREAGCGTTPCVTRARSAMSFGFAMTKQTIRISSTCHRTVRDVATVVAAHRLVPFFSPAAKRSLNAQRTFAAAFALSSSHSPARPNVSGGP